MNLVTDRLAGVITALNGNEVEATVHDQVAPSLVLEDVDLSIEDFPANQRALLAVGTSFVWTISRDTDDESSARHSMEVVGKEQLTDTEPAMEISVGTYSRY